MTGVARQAAGLDVEQDFNFSGFATGQEDRECRRLKNQTGPSGQYSLRAGVRPPRIQEPDGSNLPWGWCCAPPRKWNKLPIPFDSGGCGPSPPPLSTASATGKATSTISSIIASNYPIATEPTGFPLRDWIHQSL